MTIEKYRRVIWRLEEVLAKAPKGHEITLKGLRRAIMLEIGTDDRTIAKNMEKMIELKYIKRTNMWRFRLLVGSHDVV